MEEAVTFWLDNKISSGFKVAEIGSQVLVSYRDKFYVIEGGAAQMKGVRPLHYSKTSMPPLWKRAMKGILPPLAAEIEFPEEENLPVTTSTKKERTKMQKPAISVADRIDFQPQGEKAQQAPPKSHSHSKALSDVKPIKATQTVVVANCPYCNQKHDLAIEKGKNGKPFFVACARCSIEFAVRFVPVTMYQAQVAAFR
ncbi:MAG: hypothetical protein WCL71_05240 [Deltaproteobacteria bacterium]